MSNIVLIGMMGTFKTTLGISLSKRFKLPFYDSDLFIAKKENLTIPEIFQKVGEEGFRKIEREVIKELSKLDNVIISTGGGVPLDENNMQALMENGKIVLLKASAHTIFGRIKNSSRPFILNGGTLESLQALLAKREPIYEKYSGLTLDSANLKLRTLEDKIYEFYKT